MGERGHPHPVMVAPGPGSDSVLGERGGGTSSAGDAQGGLPRIPRTREALLAYVNTVYGFLTRLGEWEIEFTTIRGS